MIGRSVPVFWRGNVCVIGRWSFVHDWNQTGSTALPFHTRYAARVYCRSKCFRSLPDLNFCLFQIKPDEMETTMSNLSKLDRDVKDTAANLKESAATLRDDGIAVAKETASNLRDGGMSMVDDLTSQAQKTMDSAVHKAKDMAGAATEEAERQVDHAKAAVVDTVERASKALSDTSVGNLASKVKDFAKENPTLFVAGFALAGLALARLLRASVADDAPRKAKGKSAKAAAKRAAAELAKAQG